MRFKKIYIEITNTCNLSCAFCVQNSRAPKRMSVEEFSYVLSQVKPYTKYVYLHVLGEPLSHPELEQILLLCEEAGIQVNMTTNGTLLKSREELLQKAAIRQLNISLHSFPQHLQERYLEEAIMVGKALAKKKTYVSYRLWALKNQQLPEEARMILDTLSKAYEVSIDQIQSGTLRLHDYTFLHFEEVFEWPSLQHPMVSDQGYCLGMKQMCAILSDGSVVPCCLDSKADICLGNIFETPFQELIESKRAQQMVQSFQCQHASEALCKRCSYRLRFDSGRTC